LSELNSVDLKQREFLSFVRAKLICLIKMSLSRLLAGRKREGEVWQYTLNNYNDKMNKRSCLVKVESDCYNKPC